MIYFCYRYLAAWIVDLCVGPDELVGPARY